jgi:hypothetical protein
MGIAINPSIPMDGLQLLLDAGNPRSYPGSGTDFTDISTFKSEYNSASSGMTYPTFVSNGLSSEFQFTNNGSTINNIQSTTENITTNTQTRYSRIVMFKATSFGSQWTTLIGNSIGNNIDMALTVENGTLAFHQYTGTNDFNLYSTTNLSANTWYMAGMTVDLVANEVSFYLNGRLDRALTPASMGTTILNIFNSIGNSNSNTILLGGPSTDSYSGGRMLNGSINLAMHYDRILSSSEMETIWSAYRGRFNLGD